MLSLFAETPVLGYLVTSEIVIYAIAAGAFLSFVAYWFSQNIAGKLVRRLLAVGVGSENAKSLDELKINTPIYRFLLRDGSALRNLVACVENKDHSTDEGGKKRKRRVRTDTSKAHFYIDEASAEKAHRKYPKKVNEWWLLLMLILSAGIAFGLTYLIPFMLGLF